MKKLISELKKTGYNKLAEKVSCMVKKTQSSEYTQIKKIIDKKLSKIKKDIDSLSGYVSSQLDVPKDISSDLTSEVDSFIKAYNSLIEKILATNF